VQTHLFKPAKLAYVRVFGSYGEGYSEVLSQLRQWAVSHDLAKANWLFIYRDDPQLTPAQQCRTDIALVLPDDAALTAADDQIRFCEFAGGCYSSMREQIWQSAGYANAWAIMLQQVNDSRLETDQRPYFERYHSYDQENGVADVSFCVATKP